MLEVTSAQVEAEADLDFADSYALSELAEDNDNAIAKLCEPREGEADLRLEDLAAASAPVQVGGVAAPGLLPYMRSACVSPALLCAMAWFQLLMHTSEGQPAAAAPKP